MLRSWMSCFLLSAVAVGLQLFPITGVFMMMLVAPFWSVILINLGFVLMARDAWRDQTQRWLIVFPLLWFGGYFIVASVSHWQASRYVMEIVAANAGKRIAFDANRQDVVIEPDASDETNGSALRAQSLVDNFNVTQAYEHSSARPGEYRSYAIVGMVCPTSTVVKNFDGTATIFLRPIDNQGNRMSFARELCSVKGSQPPERPTVYVRPQPQKGYYSGSRVSQDIQITALDGAKLTLRSGWARPLSWLPQPVIGCGLDSGAPAWRCFAAFQRQTLYDPHVDRMPQSAEKVVARALGLAKLTLRQRYPTAGWH